MFKTIKHIHFIGIGGAGMSGIAEVLLKLGYKITGSDLTKTAVSKRLEEMGATIWEGHGEKNIEGAHVVVTSTAVAKNNPEVTAAHKNGVPVIPRIEMLAELARLKYTIAIGGTHGKTTTTSLIGQILQTGGLDPTVIVGGRLKNVGTGGVLGKGDFMVAEADESDESFLKLSPAIAVITNIDNDHLDYYKTEKRLLDAFATFANKTPFYGLTVLCGDDAGVQKILPKLNRRFETYGFGKNCDWQAESITAAEWGTTFNILYKGIKLGSLRIPLSGQHNVLNSLAATAVGTKIGLSFGQIKEGLFHFEGVGRRMEVKGMARGITVIDDYGHHPTEIKATLAAIRDRWPKSRVVVLFQPHRYSRTQLLYKEFASALSSADKLFLLPIYPAGEKPIKGVSSGLIIKHGKIKKGQPWTPQSMSKLKDELKKGDVFLTLGAGDVWKVGEKMLQGASVLFAKISQALPELGSRIKSEEPLSRHCTWAIGGPAEVFVEVHNIDELRIVQKICKEEAASSFLLGWGSNVLFPDEGMRGCVIRLRGEFESIKFEGTSVRVGGGVHLPKLAKKCAEKNLSGTEGLAGVPGTVGGALMTNAGTPRGVIGDVVSSVEVISPDGNVSTIQKEALRFNYRQSSLPGKWVVSAVLTLRPSVSGSVSEKIKEELLLRSRTQPLGTRNVGSVFKNPANDYSARLIEAVGLKGKPMGRVQFSPKHANFMENTGGASADDVLKLMALAQQLVRDKFGIDLEPEVKIISSQPAAERKVTNELSKHP